MYDLKARDASPPRKKKGYHYVTNFSSQLNRAPVIYLTVYTYAITHQLPHMAINLNNIRKYASPAVINQLLLLGGSTYVTHARRMGSAGGT